MKSIYAFLFAVFLIPSLGYSQSNYKAGYIITLKGDTTHGYINYKEWDNNPLTVTFKKETQSPPETFAAKDISAFGVTGQLYYQRYIVSVSQDQVEMTNMNTRLDTTTRVDTVFLRLLNRGRYLTLYSFKDKLKSRYYALENGQNEPYELIYHAYSDFNKDESTAIQYIRRYRTQLQNILQRNNIDNSRISTEIEQSDYVESDLSRVAKDINGKSSDGFTTPNIFGIRFFAGAGVSYTQSKFAGNIGFASSPASSSTSPAVNAGIDFLINKNIQKFFFRAEVSFTINGQYKFVTTDVGAAMGTATLQVKQYNTSITPQLVYNLYNQDNLKVFIDAGVSMNLATYNDYKTVTVYDSFPPTVQDKFPEFSKSYWSFPLKAGLVLNKRIEVYGGFTPSAAITELTKNSITTYRAGVNYLFK
jgi:hypothetical protein